MSVEISIVFNACFPLIYGYCPWVSTTSISTIYEFCNGLNSTKKGLTHRQALKQPILGTSISLAYCYFLVIGDWFLVTRRDKTLLLSRPITNNHYPITTFQSAHILYTDRLYHLQLSRSKFRQEADCHSSYHPNCFGSFR
jgi:hypothetical protein